MRNGSADKHDRNTGKAPRYDRFVAMAPVSKCERDLADRHELYEESVQGVEEECEFVSNTFKSIRGRTALSFREDFCGTASAACQWVRQGPEHTAIGVDFDPEVLSWGIENRVGRLDAEQKQRIELIEANVLEVGQ